jgi:hypothetical protein
MTDDDDITVVPMKELARLRKVEAAARVFSSVFAASSRRDWPGAPRNKEEEELELALIALDIAFMTEEELAQAQGRDRTA